jgi:hypothetical protein
MPPQPKGSSLARESVTDTSTKIATLKLSDVFGIHGERNPLSYVERGPEREFREAIDDGDSLIVVFGISKQGKSSLIRETLKGYQLIQLDCDSTTTCEDLYKEMLAQNGVQQVAGRGVKGGLEGEAGAGWFKVKLSAKGELTYEPVTVNLSNSKSVSRLLAKHTDRRLVVVDNFHYLDDEVQEQFGTAMRVFESAGFKFVVVGTWPETKYLPTFPSDFAGRIREIPMLDWEDDDLRSVLVKGCPLLRIEFSQPIMQSLVTRSVNNVALLQELVKRFLRLHKVLETERERKLFHTESDKRKVEEAARSLENLSLGIAVRGLRTVAAIGADFFMGRSRSYWILTAYLAAKDNEIRFGMDAAKLLESANALIAKEFSKMPAKLQSSPKPEIREQDFWSLIKVHWPDEQKRRLKSPVLLYNDATRSIVICDSWVKFVLRAKRAKVSTTL